MTILEVVNVSRDVAWLPWAVQYFFLVGLSVACFFMSLRGLVLGAARERRFARDALIGALACGLVAPVALLADLHQPGRFWHFYAYPNLGSWMAWGAFFIPAYVGGLLVYAWAVLRGDLAAAGQGDGVLARLQRLVALGGAPAPRLARLAAGWTVVFGLLILLYTGMEVMVVRARPLWDTPILPLQFAATAVTGAAGLVLIVARLRGDATPAADAAAARWMAGGLLATVLLGLVWLGLGLTGVAETHARALASVAGHRAWQLTAAWAALATVLPLALLWGRPAGWGWIVGLLGLHAAWMFRWTVFIGGQTVPKTGAGLYVYQLPLGHDGLLGIAGSLGLWVFVFVLLTTLLPPPPPVPVRPALVPAE
ncbi:Tetrathionate reductase subunit C [Rhodoplanes serenus]|uniref:Tetrathionate reductase subunit C n=1 Tax=Rhodoplanes serenus TaxID=200615 RepID=A0A447CVB4_9BRAD|nr:NrfD/PsrC family molybdoenzyme membrane anchor subunit [Rhodoplanes serenus]VCU09250.1 Tetrathionate reductase subunit C [Rhodoplanes serenus]